MKIVWTDSSNDRCYVEATDKGKKLGRGNDWVIVPSSDTTYTVSSGLFSRELIATDNPIVDTNSPAEETHVALFTFIATVGSNTITSKREIHITVVNQEYVT